MITSSYQNKTPDYHMDNQAFITWTIRRLCIGNEKSKPQSTNISRG
jgi:hypothetical protein